MTMCKDCRGFDALIVTVVSVVVAHENLASSAECGAVANAQRESSREFGVHRALIYTLVMLICVACVNLTHGHLSFGA
jgi:hypothetical protein